MRCLKASLTIFLLLAYFLGFAAIRCQVVFPLHPAGLRGRLNRVTRYLPGVVNGAQGAFQQDQRRLAILRRARRFESQIQHDLYPPKPHTGPLRVVASRYYDTYKERYVSVDSVVIQELGVFGPGPGAASASNVADYNTCEAVLPRAKIGTYYRVVVTWKDGSTRSWDYRVRGPGGLRVDVSRPL